MALAARRRAYRVVDRYPGLHLSEVARQAGLDTNHAKYHLQHLERHGLVSSREEGGHVRFFPSDPGPLGRGDRVPLAHKRMLAVLRQPVPLHAVLVLLARGPASHAELETEVAVSRTTLHYHMAKLERAGVVASQRQGRHRVYRVADPEGVHGLLLRHQPPDALVRGFLEAWDSVRLP